MSRKSINFDDKKINKSNFHKNKKLFKRWCLYKNTGVETHQTHPSVY